MDKVVIIGIGWVGKSMAKLFPDNRGFKSKCIPKDVYAWATWAESVDYKPEITRAILERNKKWISL